MQFRRPNLTIVSAIMAESLLLAGKLWAALTRRLYQRGWTKQEVLDLYEFIDWLLALPDALEDAFLDEIHELEESEKMRYISSAERIGMRRGAEQGFKLGTATTLNRLLRRRFGPLPDWVEIKLQEAPSPQLEQWTDQVLDADTLELVFRE
ncbi:MAG: hypothetical protein ACOYMW_07375 [Candidatus Competibacteraceae bacterium]